MSGKSLLLGTQCDVCTASSQFMEPVGLHCAKTRVNIAHKWRLCNGSREDCVYLRAGDRIERRLWQGDSKLDVETSCGGTL